MPAILRTFRTVLLGAILVLGLLSAAGAEEPIKLKLSFTTSDRSTLYQSVVKPFVDAVNADAEGLLDIEVLLSRTQFTDWSQQAQRIQDGVVDMGFVIPGASPDRFPDTAVLELAGLYRNVGEATLVFNKLISSHLIRGCDDFVVIGAFASEPETIHMRAPVAGLDDLMGRRIRVNNASEAAAMRKLGMSPVMMPIYQAAEAISGGKIDGATAPRSLVIEFGIGRIATNHYLLLSGSVPQFLLMNRRIFENLPAAARDIISRYSGEWAAEHFIRSHQEEAEQAMDRLVSDVRRKVVSPTPSDRQRAQAAFSSVIDEFVGDDPHKREILQAIKAELARIRSSSPSIE